VLEIKQSQHNTRRHVIIIVALFITAVGIYIVVTALSPAFNLAVVSGKAPDETVKKMDQPAGSNGDRLYIPQINVDVAIIEGADGNALEKGAWHRKPENGDPAKGGNFILSAHRFVMSLTPSGTVVKSPFYNIGKLTEGDRIVVDFKGERYPYVIKKKYTVAPSAVEIEAPSKEPKLTLYSCTLEGSTDGRDVFEAVPAKE
jgi:sortase A